MCVVNVNECDKRRNGGFLEASFRKSCLGKKVSFPITGGDKVNRKRRHIKQSVSYKWNGGCRPGTFCYVTDGYLLGGCQAYAIGHCCPHSCPVGEPHPSATCENGADESCNDVEGYTCHRSYLTSPALETFGDRIGEFFPHSCCPMACPRNFLQTEEGHCYPEAKTLDHACWRDEQCFDRQCIAGKFASAKTICIQKN